MSVLIQERPGKGGDHITAIVRGSEPWADIGRIETTCVGCPLICGSVMYCTGLRQTDETGVFQAVRKDYDDLPGIIDPDHLNCRKLMKQTF